MQKGGFWGKIGDFVILIVRMCRATEIYKNRFSATAFPESVLKYFSKTIAFSLVSTAT